MNKLRDAAKKNGVGYLEIKNLYNEFDTEKNGFLSHGELKAAMKSLNVEMNADEMKALIRHFDSNGNGTIHYSEFSFAFCANPYLEVNCTQGTYVNTEHINIPK